MSSQIAFGIALIAFGVVLVWITLGKSKDWAPRLADLIVWRGGPSVSARDKVRGLGYIATAVGAPEIIRAIWFPGR